MHNNNLEDYRHFIERIFGSVGGKQYNPTSDKKKERWSDATLETIKYACKPGTLFLTDEYIQDRKNLIEYGEALINHCGS